MKWISKWMFCYSLLCWAAASGREECRLNYIALGCGFYRVERGHFLVSITKQTRVPLIYKRDHRRRWRWQLVLFCLNFQCPLSSRLWFLWWPQQKKLCTSSFIILLYHILGRRGVRREKEWNVSCCCSRIILHWLIVEQRESASTADSTLLVSSKDRWNEKPLASPGMSNTLAATSMGTTTGAGRDRSHWVSAPASYSDLLVTAVLSFTKVQWLHRHHWCEISPRL